MECFHIQNRSLSAWWSKGQCLEHGVCLARGETEGLFSFSNSIDKDSDRVFVSVVF